jgi:hypothetical protein
MNKKTLLTLGVVALIAVLAVAGASAAWLTSSAEAENQMKPAMVEIEIVEDPPFSPPPEGVTTGTVDKEVYVENSAGTKDRPGTYAYIRVAIVRVWRNEDGSGTGLPVNNVTLNTTVGEANSKWFLYDGYYYFKDPVPPDGATTKLLKSYTIEEGTLTDEYIGKKLEITILASAIQAIGGAAGNEETNEWNWPEEAVEQLTPYDEFIAEPTEP